MRTWKTLARRVVYSYLPWMEVAVEKIELPDGKVINEYLSVRTRDFAMIVAFTEDGRIVMERSYKHGVRRVSLSLPAGYVEEDEDPLAGAKRELLEETGYAADDWRALGTWVVDGNYGVCSEHAFVARGARRVKEPDHGDLEEIAVELHSVDEVRAALRSGDVAQLSAAAALGVALALSELPAIGA
jgi:ADP-ribose pyrophosphatase